MLVRKNLSYLIKSYLRENSYNEKELSIITKVPYKEIRKIIYNKKEICSIQTLKKIIKNLKLSKIIAWEAYFNSLRLLFNEDPSIELIRYEEINEMVKCAKKNRKLFNHNSRPMREIDSFIKFGLNIPQFSFYIRFEFGKNESGFSKKTKLSKKVLKELKGGKRLPSIIELKKVISGSSNKKKIWVDSYISQVILKEKLNFYINEKPEESYLNLLDLIYNK